MSAAIDYRPRHSWGDARLSTTHAQLAARLIVVDAAPHSTPLYRGRHRFENRYELMSDREASALADLILVDAELRGQVTR